MSYDAIGYTGYKFKDGRLIPVEMVKAKPHNFHNEVARLERRLKKLNSERKLGALCMWSLMYGFSIRVLLSL